MPQRYDSLTRRVNRLIEALNPPREPREWSLSLEEGEEVSAELLAHIGPYDTLTIEELPRGYFGDEYPRAPQSMSCWVGKESLVISERESLSTE